MNKVRINDLARELEVKSRPILDALEAIGVSGKTHSSSIEEDQAQRVRAYIKGDRSSATVRQQPDAKLKVDLSGISKPGDALRAIRERRNAQATPSVVVAPAPKVIAPSAAIVSRPPVAVAAPAAVRPVVVSPASSPASPSPASSSPASASPASASPASASPAPTSPPAQVSPAPAPFTAPPTPASPPVVAAPRRIVPLPNQGARIIAQPVAAPAIASRPPAGPVVAKAPPTHFVPSVFGKPASTTPVVVAAPPKPPAPAPAATPPAPVVAGPIIPEPVAAETPTPAEPAAEITATPAAPPARRVIMPQTGPRPIYTAPAPAPGAAAAAARSLTRPGPVPAPARARCSLAPSSQWPAAHPAHAGPMHPTRTFPGGPGGPGARRTAAPRLHARRPARLPCPSRLSTPRPGGGSGAPEAPPAGLRPARPGQRRGGQRYEKVKEGPMKGFQPPPRYGGSRMSREPMPITKTITVTEGISVKDLAEKLDVRGKDLIARC